MLAMIISGVALFVAIVSVGGGVFLYRKLTKLQHTHNLLLKDLAKSRDSLQKRVLELSTSNINLGGAIQGVVSELQQTKYLQDEMKEEMTSHEQQDPESRFYTRAVKLVELGANLEEIMRECELPRAEAELLLNFHRK
jgi:heme oxygenase